MVNQKLTPDDIIKCDINERESQVDSTTDIEDSPIKKKPKITPAKVSSKAKANSAVKKMLAESKLLSAKKRAREIFAHTATSSDEDDVSQVSEMDKLRMQIQELTQQCNRQRDRDRDHQTSE